MKKTIIVVGAGLAGSEAAYQASLYGARVRLYEMRPFKPTPAHKTSDFAELVCSNSLKSVNIESATGILKEEMRRLNSLTINAAYSTRVPAGKALAVDRVKFSEFINRELENNPNVDILREEITRIPGAEEGPVVIATGPLTSSELAKDIESITSASRLYFYDSISPIIAADSLDYSKVFRASRYDDGSEREGDYINVPLNKEQYHIFIDDLLKAERISDWEFENTPYFEGCLPIEVMAERGADTLRYGPMKPVGLTEPATGRRPYAVIQLRMENTDGTMYNMVGFQTKLRYPEQKRILRKLPGLENAEFYRYGSIHRNTYIHSPSLLNPTLELRNRNNTYFAGQITGVEGYVESAAMGIVAGINAARITGGLSAVVFPEETAIGSLLKYISSFASKNFQPMNINFGLFPPVPDKMRKKDKRSYVSARALASLDDFIEEKQIIPRQAPALYGVGSSI